MDMRKNRRYILCNGIHYVAEHQKKEEENIKFILWDEKESILEANTKNFPFFVECQVNILCHAKIHLKPSWKVHTQFYDL